ncbi:unnamed protein product [Wickerhamomyces anomalus]
MSINETEFKNIADSTNIELLPLHNRKSTQSPSLHNANTNIHDHNHIKLESSTPQLPLADRPQFILLVILYLLQGIPVGLAFGNVMDQLILKPEENLTKITIGFFSLVMLCATQDIAVDGWALTILSEQGLSYASTAQTVGLNTGYFMSFTVFLAFNSSGFSNKYLRSIPQELGVLSLNSYLKFWGVMYLLVTVYVFYKVQEDPRRKDRLTSNDNSGFTALKGVYKTMFQVLRLPAIKTFITLHLISKIGFLVNESATNLKLLEKGFAREDLAITVLIDFPFEIIFGYYVAKWSTGKNSLTPWLYAYLGRLTAAILAQIIVYMFPESGQVTKTYFILVILHHLLGSFMSTIQFVSISAFHTQISDPLIGGTYMTLLNTISNLGGQWPKFIILNMIDFFTIKECTEDDKCTTIRDGYYVTNWICITLIVNNLWRGMINDLSQEDCYWFVQALANLQYLNFLAQNKYLQDSNFLHYLKYLEYWRKPEYAKYLVYPNCLHILTLLQTEQFREQILRADVAGVIMNDMVDRWKEPQLTFAPTPLKSADGNKEIESNTDQPTT